ncbi:ankyrin repeat-containing domain protein, partial [Jimgerdemannia flammicorona]
MHKQRATRPVRAQQATSQKTSQSKPLSTLLSTPVTLDHVIQASNTRNFEQVKRCLRADPALALACDERGRTLLHHACGKGHLQVVEHILSTAFSTTPSLLHQKDCGAARFNHPHITLLLLRQGASLAVRDAQGNTPLHIAAHTGKGEMIEMLVGQGADVGLRNTAGRTPLDEARASSFSNGKVVGLLKVASESRKRSVESVEKAADDGSLAPHVQAAPDPPRHYVRSKGEALIDDWLYYHRIWHSYEHQFIPPTSPSTPLTPDFYLPDYDVYLELWGFADDDPAGKLYTARRREKEEIYERFGAPVIGVGQEELKCLDDVLARRLAEWK